MRIAHLGRVGGDVSGLVALRDRFERRNPGYRLAATHGLTHLDSGGSSRIVFVQEGQTEVVVGSMAGEVGAGDVILQRPGQELAVLGDPIDVVAFTVPEEPPGDLPVFLRPDVDPRIADVPGGCATDDDAYRRVVLTWRAQNGPYVYQALNTHRVCMTDSFSHYHPVEDGFDELYLVQGVRPGACLLTSDRVELIEQPDRVRPEDLDGLVRRVEVEVGDLIWVGRGQMHRGVGGVLAHVITVPGFVPGAEIGVDHHLRAINERLGLRGERALPYYDA